jgi:DNA-binding NarL/FixJ family response regulator
VQYSHRQWVLFNAENADLGAALIQGNPILLSSKNRDALPSSTSPDFSLAAIRSVAQGYSQLGSTITLKVFSQLKPAGVQSHLNLLSKREFEVLKHVGQGKNNQEIAQDLYLSEGTVKNYVTQILNKLEMRDRIQLALWAQQHLR